MSVIARTTASVNGYGDVGQVVLVDEDDSLFRADPPLIQRVAVSDLSRDELDALAGTMGLVTTELRNRPAVIKAIEEAAATPQEDAVHDTPASASE